MLCEILKQRERKYQKNNNILQSNLPLYLQTLCLLGASSPNHYMNMQKMTDFSKDINNMNMAANKEQLDKQSIQTRFQPSPNPQQRQTNNVSFGPDVMSMSQQELIDPMNNLRVNNNTFHGWGSPHSNNSFMSDLNSPIFSQQQLPSFHNINNNNNNFPNMTNAQSCSPIMRSSSTYSTFSGAGESFEKSLDNLQCNFSNNSTFIRPLSQYGVFATMDSDERVKIVVPMDKESNNNNHISQRQLQKDSHELQQASSSSSNVLKSKDSVTLKITDEKGNVTNQRKLPTQPNFITRSTSEKCPNRSQVQRAMWGRHTTK